MAAAKTRSGANQKNPIRSLPANGCDKCTVEAKQSRGASVEIRVLSNLHQELHLDQPERRVDDCRWVIGWLGSRHVR